ncbi:hypothetical protein FOL47_004829 [Perkinsus chesapeaki]|uniref:Uncharacterized protein n=1 Tax=Perkinsus chesapeaki TaxID=330153 RepID=A0A7J6M1C6_PERCH|nr:hypothetical protein FOL47_004829 [Perkinsus chesapeaki]
MILECIVLSIFIKYVIGAATKEPVLQLERVTDRIETGTYSGSGKCDKAPDIEGFELKVENRDGKMSGKIKSTVMRSYRQKVGMLSMVPLVWLKRESLTGELEVDNLGEIPGNDCFAFDPPSDTERAFKRNLATIFRKTKRIRGRSRSSLIFFCLVDTEIAVLLFPKEGDRFVYGAHCGYKLSKGPESDRSGASSSRAEGTVSTSKRSMPLVTSLKNKDEVKRRRTVFPPDGVYNTSTAWSSPHRIEVSISTKSEDVLSTVRVHGDRTVDLPEVKLEEKEDGCFQPEANDDNADEETVKFNFWTISLKWDMIRICPAPDGGWEIRLLNPATKLSTMRLPLRRI